MKISIPQFLNNLGQFQTFEECVAYTQKNQTLGLAYLFNYAWNPNIIFDLQIPEYTSNTVPDGMGDINLLAHMRRMYVFTKYSPLNPERKKRLFLSLVRDLSKEEARVVTDLITGKIREYRNFTPELVHAVYPLIPLPQVVENKELKFEVICDLPVLGISLVEQPIEPKKAKKASNRKVKVAK